jgi:STE24 endopeptidase
MLVFKPNGMAYAYSRYVLVALPIMLAVLAWLLPQPAFYHALGVTTPSPAAGLILFSIVIPLVMFFVNPLAAWWSRRHEFEADAYAATQADADALISALVTMYRDNASTLTPDELYSLFYDSHPAAAIRIARLQQLRNRAAAQHADPQASTP